jgi:hypothetical protein
MTEIKDLKEAIESTKSSKGMLDWYEKHKESPEQFLAKAAQTLVEIMQKMQKLDAQTVNPTVENLCAGYNKAVDEIRAAFERGMR